MTFDGFSKDPMHIAVRDALIGFPVPSQFVLELILARSPA